MRFIDLQAVRVHKDPESGRREVVPVSEKVERVPADLVLLAIGFAGVEPMRLLDDLGPTWPYGARWTPTSPGTPACPRLCIRRRCRWPWCETPDPDTRVRRLTTPR